jgi:hypothetical protein
MGMGTGMGMSSPKVLADVLQWTCQRGGLTAESSRAERSDVTVPTFAART